MSKRFLAAGAVAAAAAVALAPAAAFASGTGAHAVPAKSSPFVKPNLVKSVKPSLKTYHTSFTKTRAASPADSGAITGSVTVNQDSALSVDAEPMNLADSAGTITSYVYDFGDGTTPVTENTAQDVTHTYAHPGTYTVTATISDNVGNVFTATQQISTAGSDFTPYGPTRVLDTRNGTGVAKGKVGAGKEVTLSIAGTGTIPQGVTAVVMNITVTDATGSGWIAGVADEGASTPVPTTSNVNYVAGQTVPNLAIVPVGADGKIDLYNGGGKAGPVDLVADVTGYFTAAQASGYTALSTPDRLVDTRNSAIGGVKGPVAKNGTFNVQIAGADGGALPASGITAVALNITVTAPTGNGYVEAYPAGTSAPNTSNVNYTKGQTIANSVVVPVSDSGAITVLNTGAQAGSAQVIVDVVGYYSPGSASAYVPVPPQRLIDTRTSTPGPEGSLPNGAYIYDGLAVDENGNFESSFTGIVVNATVTDTKGNGFLTVDPDPYTYADYINSGGDPGPNTPPNVSNLNWTKGETVPNLVQAGFGNTGVVDFWNLGQGGGDIDLVVDMLGFYQND